MTTEVTAEFFKIVVNRKSRSCKSVPQTRSAREGTIRVELTVISNNLTVRFIQIVFAPFCLEKDFFLNLSLVKYIQQ